MPNIFRAYTPTVTFKQNSFFQKALSVVQASPVLSTQVDSTLPHRKVWAALISVTAGAVANFDLVGTLNGREVLRVQMSRYTGTNVLFRVGFNVMSTNVGGISEALVVFVASTTFYSISPLRLNISADTFYIDTNPQATGGISGAGSLWDGYLFVASQAGI